jgi:hypothetical protein
MADESRKSDLTEEELRRQEAEPLPPREAMSTLDPSIVRMPPVPFDDVAPLPPTE